MSINELSNEEVLYLYFNNLHRLEDYQNIISEKQVVDTISILDFGAVTVTRLLVDEDITDLEKSGSFRLTNLIHEKLSPLAELIEDADPELFKEVKSCFEKEEF